MAARVRAIWPQAPQLSQIEHFGDDFEIAVGLVRAMPPIVMVFRDVRAGNIYDAKRAYGREDKKLQIAPIFFGGAGLQMDSNMLLVKACREFLNSKRGAAFFLFSLRVNVFGEFGEVLDGKASRLIDGQCSVLA